MDESVQSRVVGQALVGASNSEKHEDALCRVFGIVEVNRSLVMPTGARCGLMLRAVEHGRGASRAPK